MGFGAEFVVVAKGSAARAGPAKAAKGSVDAAEGRPGASAAKGSGAGGDDAVKAANGSTGFVGAGAGAAKGSGTACGADGARGANGSGFGAEVVDGGASVANGSGAGDARPDTGAGGSVIGADAKVAAAPGGWTAANGNEPVASTGGGGAVTGATGDAALQPAEAGLCINGTGIGAEGAATKVWSHLLQRIRTGPPTSLSSGTLNRVRQRSQAMITLRL